MPQNPRKNTLRKKEHLSERKAIEDVFYKGRSIMERPIRLLWTMEQKDTLIPVKVAFTVPAKTFRKAVDRNLLKRRMREAYRKNKSTLLDCVQQKKSECRIMFIYTDRQKAAYAEIESKIVLTLQRLIQQTGGK